MFLCLYDTLFAARAEEQGIFVEMVFISSMRKDMVLFTLTNIMHDEFDFV